MSHQCVISIDNSQNPYALVLTGISITQGTFSPDLQTGTTISANSTTPLQLTLTGDDWSASATLTWSTGNSDDETMAVITTSFQNDLTNNYATLGVAPAASNATQSLPAYGVSFYTGGEGSANPAARFSLNPNGQHSPIYADYQIVFNTFVSNPPATPSLPGITNVVMLMLENRSFDHLLGMLYTADPPNVIPSDSVPPPQNSTIQNPINFDGLFNNPDYSNPDTDGATHSFSAVDNSTSPLSVPTPDPGEGYSNTATQLSDPTGGTGPMQGFLVDYIDQISSSNPIPNPEQILQYYSSADLPVMSTLALNYAVSDAWYASVPSETSPNRGFSLGATSDGYVNNTIDGKPSTDPTDAVTFSMNTIFNTLSACGEDWAIYYQDTFAANGGFCLTTLLFDQLAPYIDSNNVKPYSSSDSATSTFISDLNNGTLPAFSYIEPAWYAGQKEGTLEPQNGNDYHPPANLCEGENQLAAIYTAIASSDYWKNNQILLIVTFDEHGGTFDHAVPPSTVPPDSLTDWSGFGFDQLGIRVPTLLISPTIKSGTVFRAPAGGATFDHTSFSKTILNWRNIDISGGIMGARAAQAPDFSAVITGPDTNPGIVSLTPPTCPPPTDQYEQELNGPQKLCLPLVAYGITGGTYGSEEHKRVTQELHQLKSVGELKDYVRKKKGR